MDENMTPEEGAAAELEQQKRRVDRLQACLHLLQLKEPGLLRKLEESRYDRMPVVLQIEGYEHTEEIAIAALQCAHAFGVVLTFAPHPVQAVSDIPRNLSH